MCTTAMFMTSDGRLILAGNRDEMRARQRALPPTEPIKIGRSHAIFPVDADAQGTWIGVNAHAIALTLLNNYQEDAVFTPTAEPVSRGLLAKSLLGTTSLKELGETLEAAELGSTRPFILCAGSPTPTPHAILARWSGQQLTLKQAQLPLLLISSSHELEEATRARSHALAALTGDAPPTQVDDIIASFAQAAPAPGPFTVSMSREDAHTVSHTLIDLGAHHARMTYLDGPPHTNPRRHHVVLDLHESFGPQFS